MRRSSLVAMILCCSAPAGCGDDEGGGSEATTDATETTGGATTAGVTGGHMSTVEGLFEAISAKDLAICECAVIADGVALDDCLATREQEYPAADRMCDESVYLANPSDELTAYLMCLTDYELALAGCLDAADCASGFNEALMGCTGELGPPTCGEIPQDVLDALLEQCS